jgi:hypothetical protein
VAIVESEHSCASTKGLSTQQLLWFHWLRSSERLTALAKVSKDRSPLNQDTPYSPERARQANAVVLGFELLTARMRRIQSYLNHGQKQPVSETLPALNAAKLLRENIQRGDSDEAIALFLGQWRKPAKMRGRPSGSSDFESVVVLALDLHDSDPKSWTWPKVADKLLNCKSHAAHKYDDECTAKLKQAVTRLRVFLKEIQSD